MSHRSYLIILWTLATSGLLADQVSKYGVFSWLYGVESHSFAIFQTEPEIRYFSIVPLESDPIIRYQQKGFFLEAAFEVGSPNDGLPVPHVNHGALFGFLRNYKYLANAAFAAISLLAATAIILWSCQKSASCDAWLCTALGLILGGTLGNLYDRLIFNGVRDFLHWNFLFDWPVFNVADCCLVVGAFLLLLQAFVVSHPVSICNEDDDSKKNFPQKIDPLKQAVV